MIKSSGAKQFGNKQWPHAPEALLRGRLVYNVKLYGGQQVSHAKGAETVKEAVTKIKFSKQIQKSEGQKMSTKVELHVNVDGISIQDPKTKVQQYKFPLHHISFCADDKSNKKLFTFIAKDGVTGKHHCFVLGSERNAEEITLTIGQAFDLAYKRFLEKQGTHSDAQKQFFLMKQQIQKLQQENTALKARIAELESEKQYKSALGTSPANGQVAVNGSIASAPQPVSMDSLVDVNSTAQISSVNQPNGTKQPTATAVGETLFDDDFNPVTAKKDTATPPNGPSANPVAPPPIPVRIAPPPSKPLVTSSSNSSLPSAAQVSTNDTVDAFGMTMFNPTELKEYEDMQSAFSRGLSIGVEEFDLNSLDPLSN